MSSTEWDFDKYLEKTRAEQETSRDEKRTAEARQRQEEQQLELRRRAVKNQIANIMRDDARKAIRHLNPKKALRIDGAYNGPRYDETVSVLRPLYFIMPNFLAWKNLKMPPPATFPGTFWLINQHDTVIHRDRPPTNFYEQQSSDGQEIGRTFCGELLCADGDLFHYDLTLSTPYSNNGFFYMSQIRPCTPSTTDQLVHQGYGSQFDTMPSKPPESVENWRKNLLRLM